MQGLKNIRLKEYDYRSNGYYFVTLVTRFRQSKLEGRKDLLERELDSLIRQVSGLDVDYWNPMDNHVHLIFILKECKLGLGEIVRRFKAKMSQAFHERLWQPNYYEHVIRNEKALNRIREYIVNNPQAEILKFEEFYK